MGLGIGVECLVVQWSLVPGRLRIYIAASLRTTYLKYHANSSSRTINSSSRTINSSSHPHTPDAKSKGTPPHRTARRDTSWHGTRHSTRHTTQLSVCIHPSAHRNYARHACTRHRIAHISYVTQNARTQHDTAPLPGYESSRAHSRMANNTGQRTAAV